MKASYYTLGCKVNQYETQAISELLEQEGFETVPFGEDADVCLINTCAVTAESERKCRQIIRRAAARNPDAVIAVTGCYSQLSPGDISAIDGVDIITGTRDKSAIVDMIVEAAGHRREEHRIMVDIPDIRTAPFEPMTVSGFDGHTRAYIKIQDGCRSFCSYCIIPYTRGPVRSKPLLDVLTEMRGLVSAGYQEIVLTGIEVSAYGQDLGGAGLIDLLEAIQDLQFGCRVRLSSLEPSSLTPDFIRRLAKLDCICPHFHLSLQSGCDATLRRMKRRYVTRNFRSVVRQLRKAIPDVQLTTDVIVGFPGETDEEFEQTLAFTEEMRFLHIHAFPYSRRPGTLADKMPDQVPQEVKHERCTRLIASSAAMRAAILSEQPGRCVDVLFEASHDGIATGFSPDYLPVTVLSGEPLAGTVRTVELIAAGPDTCNGRIVD